jgi:hypothetical protein
MWKSLGLTAIVLFLLGLGLDRLASSLMPAAPTWLSWILSIVVALGLTASLILLAAPAVSLVAGFYLDNIASGFDECWSAPVGSVRWKEDTPSINRRRGADCEPRERPLIKIAQAQRRCVLRARQMIDRNCRPLARFSAPFVRCPCIERRKGYDLGAGDRTSPPVAL